MKQAYYYLDVAALLREERSPSRRHLAFNAFSRLLSGTPATDTAIASLMGRGLIRDIPAQGQEARRGHLNTSHGK